MYKILFCRIILKFLLNNQYIFLLCCSRSEHYIFKCGWQHNFEANAIPNYFFIVKSYGVHSLLLELCDIIFLYNIAFSYRATFNLMLQWTVTTFDTWAIKIPINITSLNGEAELFNAQIIWPYFIDRKLDGEKYFQFFTNQIGSDSAKALILKML